MKKLLFLLLPGLLGLPKLQAVAPVPHLVAVTFYQKAVFTDPNAVLASFYDELHVPTAYLPVTGESGFHVAHLRPGKQYDLNYYGEDASDYWLSLTAPDGYALYIDGLPSNLITLTGLGGAAFDETVKVELRPVASGGALELGAFSGIAMGQSIAWELGLGRLDGDRSAGRIVFREPDLTGSPVSRDRLYYAPPGNYGTVHVVYNYSGSQTLRQIAVPAGIVDLFDESGGGYSLKLYKHSQATYNNVTNVYDFSGSPWKTVRVESPGTGELKITETEGSATRVSHLSLSGGPVSTGAYVWTLQEGDTSTWLRTTTLTSTVPSGSNRDHVVVVRTGGAAGTQVSKTRYRYLLQPWEVRELDEVVVDPDGAALTTAYTYHDTAPTLGYEAHRGNYGRVKTVTYPTGNWIAYEYYDAWNQRGQLKKQYQPFASTPTTAGFHTSGLVTSFQYNAADWSGRYTRLTQREQHVNGVAVGKTTRTSHGDVVGSGWGREYYTDNAFRDATNSQAAYVERYRGDAGWGMEFKPYDQRGPDGSRTVWSYTGGTFNYTNRTFGGLGGSPDSRVLIVRGQTSSSGADLRSALGSQNFPQIYLVPNKSTVEAVIRSGSSQILRTELYVYGGSNNFFLTTYEDFYYNAEGRLIQRVANNGATVDYTYENGRLKTVTEADGVVTEHAYDELGRVKSTVKQGATGGSHANQGAIYTHHVYDGANRVVETVVSPSSTKPSVTSPGDNDVFTTYTYDQAGRLTGQTDFAGSGKSLTTSYNYSLGARTVETTLPGGAKRTAETFYDGQLKSVTGDAVVHEHLEYAIDSNNGQRIREHRPVSSTGSNMLTTTRFDWLGRPASETTPAWGGGTVTRNWFYNSQGQLWKQTQPGRAPTLWVYNSLGQMVRTGLDLNGNDALDNNSSDRIQTIEVDFHNSGSWWLRTQVGTYATPNNATHTVLATSYERLTDFAKDTNAGTQVLRQTNSYDIHGNLTMDWSVGTRASKHVARNVLRPHSNVGELHEVYNGLPVATRDTAGITWKTEYDALGRPWKSIDPRTGTTTTAYFDSTHLVETITDPGSKVQATYAYDSAGRVASVKNVLNKYVRYEYNERGQVERRFGEAAYPVEYEYDDYGRRIRMKTFASSTASFATSWPGSPGTPAYTLWVYDAATGFLKEKYDAGNLEGAGVPKSGAKKVSYTYTSAGQPHVRTWARGVTTTYGYDGNTGELSSIDYSDSTPDVSYTYNRLGALASVIDATSANGSDPRVFVYDLAGTLELEREELSSFYHRTSTPRRLTYNYESSGVVGRLTGHRLGISSDDDIDFVTTYAYAADGRLSAVAGNRASYSNYSFSYGYVSNSNLVQTVHQTASSMISYRIYHAHRDVLTYNGNGVGPESVAVFQNFQDDMGRTVYATRSGTMFGRYGAPPPHPATPGLVSVVGYNDRSEVTSHKTYLGWTGIELTGRQDAYAYDQLGNRAATAGTTHNGTAAAYTKDTEGWNRYTKREVPGVFDIAGDADTSATVTVGGSSTGVTRHGEYYFKGHALDNSSSAVFAQIAVDDGVVEVDLPAFLPKTEELFSYDDDGNMTADGRWDYGYDAENRLVSAKTREVLIPTILTTDDARKLEFVYDHRGRRVQKIVRDGYSSGTYTTVVSNEKFVYDGWNLVARLDGQSSNALATSYVWGLDLSGSFQGAGGVGGLLMVQEGGETYWPFYDCLGNVHGMIRASDKTLAAAYEYDAFGRTVREDGTDEAFAARNPFRFSTKYTDTDTELVYYGHRYYSPSMGRFINKDPIGEEGGLNLYGFVGNNAVNSIDFLGFTAIPSTIFTGPADGPKVALHWGVGPEGLGYYNPDDYWGSVRDDDWVLVNGDPDPAFWFWKSISDGGLERPYEGAGSGFSAGHAVGGGSAVVGSSQTNSGNAVPTQVGGTPTTVTTTNTGSNTPSTVITGEFADKTVVMKPYKTTVSFYAPKSVTTLVPSDLSLRGVSDFLNMDMRLPDNPSGLGPEWTRDPGHKHPHGERYRHPSGKYLDWHPEQPGKPGWRGTPHWHSPDAPKGAKQHLPPGTEIPDPPTVPNPQPNSLSPADKVLIGAGAVGGGYLIYRGVRMVPSLVFPPLWPTIPINAAVP